MAGQITLIVVEKSTKSQNTFRRFFEQLGVRVLISASPTRAVATVQTSLQRIDGVVFSSLELGRQAVDVFNSLSSPDSFTKLPAVLIANEKSIDVSNAAQCDEFRKIIFTPISMQSVVAALSTVLKIDLSKVSNAPTTPADPALSDDQKFPNPISPDFDDDMPMPDDGPATEGD